MTWTIEMVKRDLPDVPVRSGKQRIFKARIVGRLNDYATLLISSHGLPIELAVAWPTIVNVLNRGSAVRV